MDRRRPPVVYSISNSLTGIGGHFAYAANGPMLRSGELGGDPCLVVDPSSRNAQLVPSHRAVAVIGPNILFYPPSLQRSATARQRVRHP